MNVYCIIRKNNSLPFPLGIQPNNAGQVMRELLVANGCNIKRFVSCVNSKSLAEDNFTRVRKKRRRYVIHVP